ncbi:P-loop containing nucleoside triphosphate hydrolase protein [Fusarium flagelliforme]|uniref:Cell division control protein n=1 Tax=Fusarium flagelliforme TaxID=2675880 RepID=A0A395MBK5_9HYPO|nr:P-loop containing nucleoside triphosphate hydrolase protein [Fusarium flagelliforme]KAH7197372.1 P-loop containing nucleoside triphosphate hydrolase protein [Fusarium flagelliforme]RFN44479.1 cell division control protein 6 [Fusarium flagelliforme]
MARTASLGKRARGIDETDIPCQITTPKRSRRLAKAAFYNDENQDPAHSPFDDEEDDVLAELPPRTRKSPSQTTTKQNPVTPSTPRHRDALSVPPTTPRHAVMSAGKLFKRLTPHTPLSPSTIQTVYHQARQLFARGAEPGQLVGREEERNQLTQFLNRYASSTPNGCLYVSGPPGTGKSAMITEITRQYANHKDIQSAYVNCMSVKSSKDLYTTLLGALGQGFDASEADAITTLQGMFVPKTKSGTVYLVTLDEIDHILTMGLESLYRVFEWSLQKNSRLILVGIANALDLTDRFLPRLKAKNLKPDLMAFLPYTATQVKNIITTRLQSLMPAGGKEGWVPFIHPAAIDLCSRKVSKQTGDLRKAFEICRRALDLIEVETRSKHEEEAREELLQMSPSKRPLGENINGASGGPRSVVQVMANSLKALTAETAPRASISHLNKITAAAFSNGTTQRLKALNLQQKAALCALVAYEKRIRSAAKMANGGATPSKSKLLAPTIKTLFDAYCQLCTRDSVLHPLSSSEFREVAGSLETLGLVTASDGKTGSFAAPQTPSKRGRKTMAATGDERRLTSCVAEKEMESVADGVGAAILKSILSGEALD